MKPITLADGTTITPNPPGYWWAEIGRIAEKLVRDCDAMHEIATHEEKATPSPRGSRDWSVSEETLERIRTVMTEEPWTVSDLAKAAGASPETIRRAMQELRDRDEVRWAGVIKHHTRNVDTYALMPEVAR